MKTLYIIRHAKSSWHFNMLKDCNRPLGRRGRKQVLKMSKYLVKHIKKPDQIIASPTSRAFYTALFMADAWDIDENNLILNDALYHADRQTLLNIIRGADHPNILAICGHNPGLTLLINSFHAKGIDNLPTCGIMGFTFDIENWRNLNSEHLMPNFYYTPRSIDKS
tara:strand:- start:8179 stop:8676 length:498 start_codon:yes stop_codon:yes gene_type:complete